jgi:hypothetical protein
MRNNKPVLLCPTVCCCPEIILKDDNFIIKDDYGSEITIPKSDIKLVINELDGILSEPGSSLDN